MEDPTRDLGGERKRRPSGVRDLAPGERIGSWDVCGVLGGGGFGTVYDVQHERTGQRAALKLLHAHFATSPEMLARFEREIGVLRRLSHPNIVQLVDAGFSDDHRPYLCMERLTGVELGKLLAQTGPLDPHHAMTVFEPLCDALALAHRSNIVHRDVKASNVLVCDPDAQGERRIALLDFGIAKLSDALEPELTASRQSLGTPACMAPEQIHGMRVDARTDIYALGGLLFHMITGRLPFQDSSPTMVQYLHLHARRPSVSNLAGVPRKLDEVIATAMAIEPGHRFRDASALLEATRLALRDTAVLQAPVTDVPCIAFLVMVTDAQDGAPLEAPFLDDMETVLPAAERALRARGFRLALDLGASTLFVARADAVTDPVGVARSVFDELQQRRGRHPRVRVGLAVHRDTATFIGAEVQPGALLQPATWNVPERIDGVWVTSSV